MEARWPGDPPPWPKFTAEERANDEAGLMRQRAYDEWQKIVFAWDEMFYEYWREVRERVRSGVYDRRDWEVLKRPIPSDMMPEELEALIHNKRGRRIGKRTKQSERTLDLLIMLLGTSPDGIARAKLEGDLVVPEGRDTKSTRARGKALVKTYPFPFTYELDRTLGKLVGCGFVAKIEGPPVRYRAVHENVLEGMGGARWLSDGPQKHWTERIGLKQTIPENIKTMLPPDARLESCLYLACRRLEAAKEQLRLMNVADPDAKINALLESGGVYEREFIIPASEVMEIYKAAKQKGPDH